MEGLVRAPVVGTRKLFRGRLNSSGSVRCGLALGYAGQRRSRALLCLTQARVVTASCVSAKKHITLSPPGCRYTQRGIFSPREIPDGEGAPDRLGPSRGVWPQVAAVWRIV